MSDARKVARPKYILRLEDRNLFQRLNTEEDMMPLRDQILAQLGLKTEDWNEATFEVRVISDDELPLKHYKDRIDGLFEGVEFLLSNVENFDETYKRKLLLFLQKVTEDCRHSLEKIASNPATKHDISFYQNSIADYTKYILSVLRSELDMPIRKVGIRRKKVDEVRERLARAEEFALAKKTKPPIITVSSLFKPKSEGLAADEDYDEHQEYMAMIDKPENPFNDFTDKPVFRANLIEELSELQKAFNSERPSEEVVELYPEWFVMLDENNRNEIEALFEDFDFNNKDERDVIINGVIANAFPSIKAELKAIQNENVAKYPEWYKGLKDFEKVYLKAFLKDIDLDNDLGTVVNAISSKLRIIPVPANYGTHTLITHMYRHRTGEAAEKYPLTPRTVVHPSEKRSSHAGSRDVKKKDLKTRQTHARRNIYKMVDEIIEEKMAELNKNEKLTAIKDVPTVIHIPILYQTLITPVKEPDTSLDEDKQAAVAYLRQKMAEDRRFLTNSYVEIKFDLISTNHPLNVGKYMKPTTSATLTGSETSKLLSLVTGRSRIYRRGGIGSIKENDLEKMEALRVDIRDRNPQAKAEDIALLAQSCIDLAKITGTNKFIELMGPYRELYIASLEQMVTSLANGGSIGSCVSGKDRKAVEIAHTDAMKTFYERFGHLPPLYPETPAQKKDATIFADIFAEIYCTKHQQALAGQNAPGSFGTKTPGMYLPKHLREAVQRWYARHDIPNTPYEGLSKQNTLARDDRLATNNDIKNISSIFPMLIARLAKRLRQKLEKHTPPEDLTWKKSSMENRDIYSIDEEQFKKINAEALNGLAKYKHETEAVANKKSMFAHTSEAKKELKRIDMLISLLGENSKLTSYQKNILLYAVMASDDPSSKLQHAILKAVNMPSLESVRSLLSSSIKHTINEYVDKLPENKRKSAYTEAIAGVNKLAENVLDYIDEKSSQLDVRKTREVATMLTAASEENPTKDAHAMLHKHQSLLEYA